MNQSQQNDRLDELLKQTLTRKEPDFDFDKWKQGHTKEIEAYKNLTAEARPKQLSAVWRIIMHSKMTKLATAAVVIIGLMTLSYVLTGRIDGTTSAFAAMSENMKKVPWLHGVVEGAGERLEAWISYDFGVSISKRSNGEVTYIDTKARTMKKYDPTANTVTKTYIDTDTEALLGVASLEQFTSTVLELFGEAGAEVVEETCEYQGKNAKRYKMRGPINGKDMGLEMTVDVKRNLPLFLNQKWYGPADEVQVDAKASFDYPDSAPASLYELGMPESAKVIDNMPVSASIPAVLDAYKAHREAAPSKYAAAVTREWIFRETGSLIPYQLSVIWRGGRKQRVEYYKIPSSKWGEWCRGTWKVGSEEMGKTFDSVVAWWKKNGELEAVDLYTGKYQYKVKFEDSKWTAPSRDYLPFGDLRADDDVADFGWSTHFTSEWTGAGPLKVIDDEYSKEHSLMCLERTSQGRIEFEEKGGITWAVPPMRKRCYLNPERDYICQRMEKIDMFDAPWQEDKEWLQKNSDKEPTRAHTIDEVREVVEYAQTSSGKWYPKVIEYRDSKDTLKRKMTVVIKENMEFSEDMFDAKRLPK